MYGTDKFIFFRCLIYEFDTSGAQFILEGVAMKIIKDPPTHTNAFNIYTGISFIPLNVRLESITARVLELTLHV